MEKSQICCPIERKNKVIKLAVLKKMMRAKHQNRAWLSVILYYIHVDQFYSRTLTQLSFLMATSYFKNVDFSNLFVYFIYIGQSIFTFLKLVSSKFAQSSGCKVRVFESSDIVRKKLRLKSDFVRHSNLSLYIFLSYRNVPFGNQNHKQKQVNSHFSE